MPAERPDKDGETTCAAAVAACAGPGGAADDIGWLLHRAAQVLRVALNDAVRAHGIDGMRDYIVLSTLCGDKPITQLALGQQVGLDKTTLTSLIDRLEKAGLVVRRIDPSNRRARFPQATEAGKALQAEISATRSRMEATLLAGLTPAQQSALRDALKQVVARGTPEGAAVPGSCM